MAVKKYFVTDAAPKVASGGRGRSQSRDDLVQLWKREASILKSVRHPNILMFFGICLDACHVYLVTELASYSLSDIMIKENSDTDIEAAAVPPSPSSSPGGAKPFDLNSLGDAELDSILSEGRKSGPGGDGASLLRDAWNSGDDREELIRKMALQIIQAVSFVHGRQIIHRDVKPDNLLVLEKGSIWTVKLADFGMARFRTAEQNDLTTLIGSPHYVAPELMKGEKNYTNSVDIYSFGMVVWALVHEQNPMKNAGVYTIVDKIVNRQERPAIVQECSPFLQSIISACWESDPNQRPKADDILRWCSSASSEAVVWPRPLSSPPSSRALARKSSTRILDMFKRTSSTRSMDQVEMGGASKWAEKVEAAPEMGEHTGGGSSII